jgi:hypothetical protein
MKNNIFIFLIYLVSLTTLACGQARQDTNTDAVNMLKEFYTAYNTAWSNNSGNVLIKKLDSLQSKYCTRMYYKELRKEFKEVGLDHDELINDVATDVDHLNTLKVVKDLKKPNEYIVSYMFFGKDVSNNPLQEKIVIHVLLIKENGIYKIAAIKNGSYTIIPNK